MMVNTIIAGAIGGLILGLAIVAMQALDRAVFPPDDRANVQPGQ